MRIFAIGPKAMAIVGPAKAAEAINLTYRRAGYHFFELDRSVLR